MSHVVCSLLAPVDRAPARVVVLRTFRCQGPVIAAWEH